MIIGTGAAGASAARLTSLQCYYQSQVIRIGWVLSDIEHARFTGKGHGNQPLSICDAHTGRHVCPRRFYSKISNGKGDGLMAPHWSSGPKPCVSTIVIYVVVIWFHSQ